MTALLRAARRRLGDERGFTFPELIIATAIALIVAAAAMMLLGVAERTQPRISERAGQLQLGRSMIERLVREVRQGESIEAASASGFQILTHVNSETCGGPAGPKATLCLVYYSCGSTSCTRTERNADGSGSAPSEEVVSGITGPSVFSFCTSTPPACSPNTVDPTYVEVRLEFPGESGAEAVTISDSSALRNYFESAPPS